MTIHILRVAIFASLLLLPAIASAQALRSSTNYPPCGESIANFEIAIDAFTVFDIQLFDSSGDPVFPESITYPAGTTSIDYNISQSGSVVSIAKPDVIGSNDCEAYISFDASGARDAPLIKYPIFYGLRTLKVTPQGGTSRFYVYAPGNASTFDCNGQRSPRSFLCPYFDSSSPVSWQDWYIGVGPNDDTISPNWMWGTTASDPVYSFNSNALGGGWVWPYHASQLCSGGKCPDGDPSTQGTYLLAPVSAPVAIDRTPNPIPLTIRVSDSITLPAGKSYDWSESLLSLAFDHGKQLIVQSQDFSAGPLTLTSSNSDYGWGGVRFEPGAVGTLSGTTNDDLIIEDVSGTSPAVYVHNADVSLNRVELNGRFQQPADWDLDVTALWVTGSSSQVSIDESLITEHTGGGIMATSGATINVSDTIISDNGVYSWGYGGPSNIYSWNSSAGSSAQASSYGTTWLGPPTIYNPTLPNNTFHATHSLIGALYASNHGEVIADVSVGHNDNWIFGQTANSRGFATASDYSDIDARNNWWGSSAGPDPASTSIDGSSAFSYCPFLTDAFSGSASTCGRLDISLDGGSGLGTGQIAYVTNGSGSGSMSGDNFEPSGILGQARRAMLEGDHAGSVGILSAILKSEPALQQRALGLLGRIGGRNNGAAARALLEVHTRSANRQWALRALAVAEAGRGRPDRSLGLAAELVAEGGDLSKVGRVIGALALAALNRPDEAIEALDEAERLAPGDPDIAMARREVTYRFAMAHMETSDRTGPNVISANPETAPSALANASKHSEDNALTFLGLPYPNPTRGTVAIPLSLMARAHVQIEIFDMLGRSVAFPQNGPLAPGAHALIVTDGTLDTGTYIVRATITANGSNSRTFTRRLSVIQ